MIEEEEAPKPPPGRLPPLRLEPMGIAELVTYREELRAEILRVEAEMARKQSHLSAADSLFRRP
ncbi:MAG: DUF1192 family protein [Acetobacteraceae bacterium]